MENWLNSEISIFLAQFLEGPSEESHLIRPSLLLLLLLLIIILKNFFIEAKLANRKTLKMLTISLGRFSQFWLKLRQ